MYCETGRTNWPQHSQSSYMSSQHHHHHYPQDPPLNGPGPVYSPTHGSEYPPSMTASNPNGWFPVDNVVVDHSHTPYMHPYSQQPQPSSIPPPHSSSGYNGPPSHRPTSYSWGCANGNGLHPQESSCNFDDRPHTHIGGRLGGYPRQYDTVGYPPPHYSHPMCMPDPRSMMEMPMDHAKQPCCHGCCHHHHGHYRNRNVQYHDGYMDGPGRSKRCGKEISIGRWNAEEHKRFLAGLERFQGPAWGEIARVIGTRTSTQVRTHAQKFFAKLARANQSLPHFEAQIDKEKSRLMIQEITSPDTSTPTSSSGQSYTSAPFSPRKRLNSTCSSPRAVCSGDQKSTSSVPSDSLATCSTVYTTNSNLDSQVQQASTSSLYDDTISRNSQDKEREVTSVDDLQLAYTASEPARGNSNSVETSAQTKLTTTLYETERQLSQLGVATLQRDDYTLLNSAVEESEPQTTTSTTSKEWVPVGWEEENPTSYTEKLPTIPTVNVNDETLPPVTKLLDRGTVA